MQLQNCMLLSGVRCFPKNENISPGTAVIWWQPHAKSPTGLTVVNLATVTRGGAWLSEGCVLTSVMRVQLLNSNFNNGMWYGTKILKASLTCADPVPASPTCPPRARRTGPLPPACVCIQRGTKDWATWWKNNQEEKRFDRKREMNHSVQMNDHHLYV